MKNVKRRLKVCGLLVLMLCVGLGGNSCDRLQEKALDKIERQGNYIMRQGAYLNQGEVKVNIKDAIRGEIKKDKKLLLDSESYDDLNYCEKDGVMYFIYRYKKDVDFDAMNSYHNDFETTNYYAFGKTPILNVDVTVSGYFTSVCDYSLAEISTVGIFGEYAIFRNIYADELFIYDCDTMQKQEIAMDGYVFGEYTSNAFALWKKEGKLKSYRIYDENLTEYKYVYEGIAEYGTIYCDYLLFDSSASSELTAEGINYKTKEELSNEEAYSLLQESKRSVVNYHFFYNDRKYRFKYERDSYSESVPTGSYDENGEPIMSSYWYDVLTVTDVETEQEYRATDEELFANAPAMAQIQEIYDGGDFDCCQIFTQNEDLFFAFVSDETLFGIATQSTSPRVVFKYNEETKKLDYIGYACYTFYAITDIYEGSLQK